MSDTSEGLTGFTSVTLPRELFEKVAILAKREHRSARGQILHLLSAATTTIELSADTLPVQPLVRQARKTPAAYGREADAERKGREAAETQEAQARELEALFSNHDQ